MKRLDCSGSSGFRSVVLGMNHPIAIAGRLVSEVLASLVRIQDCERGRETDELPARQDRAKRCKRPLKPK